VLTLFYFCTCAATGAKTRKLFPLLDMMNHEAASLDGIVSPELLLPMRESFLSQLMEPRGPSVKVKHALCICRQLGVACCLLFAGRMHNGKVFASNLPACFLFAILHAKIMGASLPCHAFVFVFVTWQQAWR
jgi:hypothetical protein